MFFRWPTTVICTAALICLTTVSSSLIAQDAANESSNGRSIRFIPPDAMIVVDIRPREILTHESSWFMPTEILEAWCDETLGVQVANIDSIRAISPMVNPEVPAAGIVIEFASDVAIGDLKPGLVDLENEMSVAGRTCYAIDGGNGLALLHAATPRRWIVGTASYLPAVFNAAEADASIGGPSSTVIELIQKLPKEGIAQFTIDLKPLRPLMMAGIMTNADEIPPAAGRLPELVNLVDAVTSTASMNLTDMMTYGSWTIWANDDAAADEIEVIIEQTVNEVASMMVSMAMQSIEGDDKVSEATRAYVRRMEQKLVSMAHLKRDGVRFSTPTADMQSFAVIGVLTGMLLPAVQSAREAARRMSASNNLKQIGLAIHNYHSAYRKLPPRAITAVDGTPLLSWRVAILPFVEQQALYEQFHLDEPWDSPHNLPLSKIMPEVYIDPSIPEQGNRTVFQSPYGEGTMLGVIGEQRRFRDTLDGLSNTIMVFETSRDESVVWSKPEDVVVSTENPFNVTGNIHVGGFHALLGDGAVRFLTNSVQPKTLNAMITRAGKEVIDFDF